MGQIAPPHLLSEFSWPGHYPSGCLTSCCPGIRITSFKSTRKTQDIESRMWHSLGWDSPGHSLSSCNLRGLSLWGSILPGPDLTTGQILSMRKSSWSISGSCQTSSGWSLKTPSTQRTSRISRKKLASTCHRAHQKWNGHFCLSLFLD